MFIRKQACFLYLGACWLFLYPVKTSFHRPVFCPNYQVWALLSPIESKSISYHISLLFKDEHFLLADIRPGTTVFCQLEPNFDAQSLSDYAWKDSLGLILFMSICPEQKVKVRRSHWTIRLTVFNKIFSLFAWKVAFKISMWKNVPFNLFIFGLG